MAVQCYFLSPNEDAPNSRLPVLHYRDVLPEPRDEASVTDFLTRNRWEKRGTWGHIGIRHFHPNSHECYGIFQGHSKMLLGKIYTGQGMEVDVKTGDVIILPAGTAHSSLASSSDYRYIGVYPQDCPKWRNEMGKKPAGEFKTVIKSVEMPEEDPVYGRNGPLTQLWNKDILAKL
ncbi:Uncharacterized protein CGCA056_v000124 [Colletotrichum aenigma]|uniref:Uncharacterized protein n=1 Tax=Colletotrichum aenigma TaxID=1215731 RepID=UPI0018726BBD|nr:Uncharacterized protein CGCA056_v000124 [Colletotrichum aenigma]KAF5528644.1 Uncharacterized protein CGCA056_v000124 [Colletotrichum aenigma]